jgi:PEP-CTERM motif
MHLSQLSARFSTSIYRLSALAALAALFMLLPSAAHADSNTSYDFSGTLANGSAFSGTLDFDTNGSGLTTLVNSNFTIGGTSFSCNGASSNNCTVENAGFAQYFTALSGSSLVLLSWSPINFLNPPSSFNFNGGYCMNCASGIFTLVYNGNAVAAPEPATWLMLAIGLIMIAFFGRRRNRSIAVE